MIHLAVIDGSRIFADALAARLESEPDIRVLRCATGAAALRQAVSNSSADVVIGDASLFDPASLDPPGSREGGATTGRLLAENAPAVLLLADEEDSGKVAGAVRAGVRAWISRSATVEELIQAVRVAADGGTWIPPKLLTAVLDELVWATAVEDPEQAKLTSLTPREREVLACLAEGLGRREVAERLTMSTNTVRTHVQSILSKLGVTSAVAAVALVRRAVVPVVALRLLLP